MKRKLVVLATLVASILVLWVLLRRHVTLEALASHENDLRTLLAERPLASFCIGYVAYFLVSLVPGTTGKSLIIGWLFGLWQGVLMVNFGLTTAAVLTFFVSRYLIRDAVQSRFGYYLFRVNKALEGDGAYYLFALRMMHAPFSVTNYAMGATNMPARPFWWSTQLGMLPGNVVFVYAGTQIPTLEEAYKAGLASIFSVQLVAIFVLVAVFPFAARWAIRLIWKRKPMGEDAG